MGSVNLLLSIRIPIAERVQAYNRFHGDNNASIDIELGRVNDSERSFGDVDGMGTRTRC